MRIGVGAPLTGPAAGLGREMVQAIELAVEEANFEAPDCPIETLVIDDCGDEQRGLAVARAFVEDELVAAVIGHYDSNVTLEAAPVYHIAGMPLIAPIVSNPRLTQSGWNTAFRFTNSDDATAEAIALHMIEQFGKRRVAVVETRTVNGASMAAEFSRAFLRHGGAVAERHRVKEGVTVFDGFVRALPDDMDCVFYCGTFEGALLLRALRSSGRTQLFATGDGCWDIDNFLGPAGSITEDGEGVLVLSACPELGCVDGAQDFADRYGAKHGPLANYAVNAYDAALVTTEAIRAAHGTSDMVERRKVLDALRQTKRQGVAYPDPVSFDDTGANVSALTALHVVKDGKFRQVASVARTG